MTSELAICIGIKLKKVYLCMGKSAKNPYVLEQSCLAFYSVEEICYYIKENACLVEKDIMSPKLLEWLSKECELENFAHKMMSYIHKKSALGVYVAAFLQEAYYCTKAEAEEIQNLIQDSSTLSLFERRKNSADYLLKKNRVFRAKEEYEEILYELEVKDDYLKGLILHNLATAYTKLYEYEKAAACYYQGYMLSYNPESYLCFLGAKRISLTPEAYVDFLSEDKKHYQMSMELEGRMEKFQKGFEEWEENARLQEIFAYRNSSYAKEFYGKADDLLMRWREEYRGLTEKLEVKNWAL